MALSSGTLRLIIFCLVFSIIFPVMAFALTFQPVAWGQTFDPNILKASGTFTSYDTHNITRDDAWVYYTVGSYGYRVHWLSVGAYAGNFTINHWRSYGDSGLFYAYYQSWWENSTSGEYDITYLPENITDWSVVESWDAENDWTHLGTRAGWWTWQWLPPSYIYGGPASTTTQWDVDAFFQDTNPARNNITLAINEGQVTLMLAKGWNMTTPDFWTFIGWYAGMMTFSETYGMPPIFVFFLWFLTALSIIAVILLAKEFVPWLP